MSIACEFLVCVCALAADDHPGEPRPGGANAPPLAPPPALAVTGSAELSTPSFTARVPVGTWLAGAAHGMIPGPITAVRLGTGPWIGSGYFDATAPLASFSATASATTAEATWTFVAGGIWTSRIDVSGDGVLISESGRGCPPRSAWVFD